MNLVHFFLTLQVSCLCIMVSDSVFFYELLCMHVSLCVYVLLVPFAFFSFSLSYSVFVCFARETQGWVDGEEAGGDEGGEIDQNILIRKKILFSTKKNNQIQNRLELRIES